MSENSEMMATGAQLTLEQKTMIVTLHKEKVSKREIARRIKCSDWTVRSVIKKYGETGSVERKKGSGRKRKTSSRSDAHLKFLSLSDRFQNAAELREEWNKSLPQPCSLRTVETRLNEMGLMSRTPAKKPILNKRMRKNRLNWCKERENWSVADWKRVVFSDESKFNLIGPDGTLKVRRRKGERYSDKCIQPTVKHSPYIMVWGCITSAGVGNILTLNGSVNAEKYQAIIAEGVIPTLEDLYGTYSNPIFQDDSAPCHRARSVSINNNFFSFLANNLLIEMLSLLQVNNLKENLGIVSLPWPGNSPDLNPIENVWAIMSKKIKQKKPTTLFGLENIITSVWHNQISTQLIDALYESMPLRVKDVIKAKGGATKF